MRRQQKTLASPSESTERIEMKLWQWLDKWRISRYTEKCNGKCGDDSPHTAHLTKAGQKHYLGRVIGK